MADPRSPYTQGLVDCVRPDSEQISFIPGRIPEPGSIGEQCPFADRCAKASEQCRTERPLPRPTADGRLVACHHADLS
jgi:oligopeptide/dipeptide ABC transporter ATP-binding protein